jgi:hypothetical protein
MTRARTPTSRARSSPWPYGSSSGCTADGLIERVFGHAIPVLIHELEYYDEIAQQNRDANPDELADEFSSWIAAM